MPARALRGVRIVLVGLGVTLALPHQAVGQRNMTPPPNPTPDAACPPEGCITGVTVTPDGGTLSVPRNTQGTATFTVRNTGNVSTPFTMTCTATGVTCGTVTPASASIVAGAIREVDVTFNVGTVNGRVTLRASNGGTATDNGFVNITAIAPAYLVAVTPDGQLAQSRQPFTGPFTANFTVTNTGDNADTYTFTCGAAVPVACGTVTPGSATLASFAQTTVAVTYTVAATGTGTISLTAQGQVSDQGSYTVPVVSPARAPVASTSPSNGTYRSPSTCAASCFDLIWAHATAPYFSLGAARSFGLVYNSSMARPTPVVALNVSNGSGYTPTTYSAQVRLTATGTLLTLLNGSQTVYYKARAVDTTRLVLPIDAVANGLATGWYDVTVSVNSNYGVDSTGMSTLPARLLINNETGSPFGLGVGAVGIPRVYSQTGSFAAMIADGDGTVAWYNRTCSGCAFVTPNGTTTALSSPSGVPWRLTYLDGSIIDFNSTGRMTRRVDRFGNTTSLFYTGTQLDSIVDPMGKALRLAYVSGKLRTVTDPSGRVTTYTVNASGRLTQVKDPDNKFAGLAYSATGLLNQVTDRDGRPVNMTYDALNRSDTTRSKSTTFYTGATGRSVVVGRAADQLVWQPTLAGTTAATAKQPIRYDTVSASIIDPLGNTTKLWLNTFGAPTKIVDVLGQATTITRDTMSRPTLVVGPSGHQVKTVYTNLLVSSAQDLSTGRTINYAYNSRNDITSITGSVPTQVFTYHNGTKGPAGALDTVKVAGLVMSVHFPDSRGRDTLLVHGDSSHKARFVYDAAWGAIVRITDPQGNVTRVHLDGVGRVDTTYAPDGGAWGVALGPMNEVVTSQNPLGQSTQIQYDENLAVKRIVDPKGQVQRYARNGVGAITAAYDLADTLLATTYGYDQAGRVRTTTTRKGETINTSYDAAGRLIGASGSGFADATYKFDPAGRWVVASNVQAYDSLALDAAGRVTKDFQRVNGVTYEWRLQYDAQDRVISRQLFLGGVAQSSGYLTRTYTGSGVLSNTSAGAVTMGITAGTTEELPVRRTVNPGVGSYWMGTVYNKNHVAVRDSFSLVGLDSIFGHQVTRDSLNRLSTVVTGTMSGQFFNATFQTKYRYDLAGRLVKACNGITQPGTGCPDEYGNNNLLTDTYTYDAAGNRTDAGAGAMVGAGNRTQQFKGYTLGYDLNGRIISKVGNGKSWSYTWDALDQLTAVRQGGTRLDTLAYDALGRRVFRAVSGATDEYYVYDGDQVVLDVAVSTNQILREYGWEPGTDRLLSIGNAGSWTGVAIRDPGMDASVLGLADENGGALLKRYQPGVWGSSPTESGVVTRFRMAGREYDQESGLYFMRSRYYDPDLGRFLSEDPQGIVGGLNLYTYANNDPINLRDTFGTCPEGYEEDWAGGGGCVRTLGGVTSTGSGHRCDLGCGGAPGWVDAGFGGRESGTGNFIGPDTHRGHGGYGLTPTPITVTDYGQAGRCGLEEGAVLAGLVVDATNLYGAGAGVRTLASGTRIALKGMAGEVGSLVNNGAAVSRAGGFVFVTSVASTASISTMAGSVRIAAGIAAVADATYISLGNQKGALNPQPGFPFSLSDLSLTMAAMEKYDKCLAK